MKIQLHTSIQGHEIMLSHKIAQKQVLEEKKTYKISYKRKTTQ